MATEGEFVHHKSLNIPEELQDVVQRKLELFEQIRALKAESRDLGNQLLKSGKLNSTILAVSVMRW
jgi:hypothetical protein